jgi:hypothetical protein
MSLISERLLSPADFSVAVKYNEDGVQWMLQGKHEESITSFQRALLVLSKTEGESASANGAAPQLPRTIPEDQIKAKGDMAERKNSRVLTSILLPEEDMTSRRDNVFVVFARALSLSSEIQDQEEKAPFYSQLLSTVLCYNIALAKHLEAIRTGSSHQLKNALEFYSLAHASSNESTMLQGIVHRDPSLILVRLGISNNVGAIHANLCSFQEAWNCSNELSWYLNQLPLQQGQTEELSISEYKVNWTP